MSSSIERYGPTAVLFGWGQPGASEQIDGIAVAHSSSFR
jgi:hypothetical protein